MDLQSSMPYKRAGKLDDSHWICSQDLHLIITDDRKRLVFYLLSDISVRIFNHISVRYSSLFADGLIVFTIIMAGAGAGASFASEAYAGKKGACKSPFAKCGQLCRAVLWAHAHESGSSRAVFASYIGAEALPPLPSLLSGLQDRKSSLFPLPNCSSVLPILGSLDFVPRLSVSSWPSRTFDHRPFAINVQKRRTKLGLPI